MRLLALALLLTFTACAPEVHDDAFEGKDTPDAPRALGPLAEGATVRAEGVLAAGDTDTLSVDPVPALRRIEVAFTGPAGLALSIRGDADAIHLGQGAPIVHTTGRPGPLVLVVNGAPQDAGPYAIEVKDLGPLPEEALEENDSPQQAAEFPGSVDLLVQDPDWVKLAAPAGARARITITGAPGGLLTIMSDALRTLDERPLTPEVTLEAGPLTGDEAGFIVGIRPAGQPPFVARLVVEVLKP
jgi:hypothetical protein